MPVVGPGPDRSHRQISSRRSVFLAVLALLVCLLAVVDIGSGPAGIPLGTTWTALVAPAQVDSTTHAIIWQLRLPQALMALVVGAALGLAGAEMQTVLNNALASPFTLGVSSAAALGAAVTLIFGWHLPYVPEQYSLMLNAFALAALCTWLLDIVARRARAGSAAIVLFGIALVFGFNAVLSLVQLSANPSALQDLVFWMMGSLARSDWNKLAIVSLVLLAVLPLSIADAWRLTALRFGDDRATSFGVDTSALRRAALLRVSALAGISVAAVGVIGFIGLIAPHIARRLWGEDHRWYLPASACIGSATLLGASVTAKYLSTEVVIPVGIVTTLVGIPFFVVALMRRPVY